MRSLNSDELGEKGESRFKELCADAKPICNQSSRDRAGWDFIVEFPFECPEGNRTLDNRPSALSCHVQVKSIWHGSRTVRLRLSSAERLAKEAKPAFVCVFVFGDDLEAIDIYLIHVRGANLSHILKRLRKAQVDGKPAVNRETIAFTPKIAGIRLVPSGTALRDQIAQACGENLQTYIASKANELERLGFENGRFVLSTTLKANGVSEIVEAFLGLRPVEAIINASTEIRFKMPLPTAHATPGETAKILIQPKPAARCTIRVFGKAGGMPIVFAGELFFPAIKVPDAYFRTQLRTKFFVLDFQGPQQRLDVVSDIVDSSALTASEWRSYFGLLAAIEGGQPRFEVTPETPGMTRFPILFSNDGDQAKLARAQKLLLLCDYIEYVLRFAGVSQAPLSYRHFMEVAPLIDGSYEILTGKADRVPIVILGKDDAGPNKFDLLYVDIVRTANIGVIYGVVVTMAGKLEDDQFVWHPTLVTQPRAAGLTDNPATYPDEIRGFIEDFRIATGIDVVITRMPGEENAGVYCSAQL